ncbi:hypothetical protein [Pigmentiphaga litoralis]|uniref:hypothetical protein n=1 Tax=Pigmentiphaga litoralis TaxID=516702 RepID=UPI003B430278
MHPPTLPCAVLPLRPGTPMEQWKQAIEAGNEAFTGPEPATALGHYRLALRLAQTLVGDWPDHDAALAALVVSHHNLADLHRLSNAHEAAITQVCDAHDALQGLIADPLTDLALRQAALRHARQTLHELLRCARTAPTHARLRASLAHDRQGLTVVAAAEFPTH